MAYSGWFLSEALEVWSDIIVEKGFFGWVNETTGGRVNTMLMRSEV